MKKRQVALMMVFVLGMSAFFPTNGVAAKSKKITLSKRTLTMKVKGKYTLKLKKANKKKIKWSSSNKAVATVKNGVVRAKKAGKCKIVARYAKKKYQCSVKVKEDTTQAASANQVTMSLKGYDKVNQLLTVDISNGAKETVSVALSEQFYTLEKLINGAWTEIPRVANPSATPRAAVYIALSIDPGKTLSRTLDLKSDFGTLTAGKYRVITQVEAQDLTSKNTYEDACVEFTVE